VLAIRTELILENDPLPGEQKAQSRDKA